MTDGERMLTASEVKVLTETATRVAYALGRKDAGEEVAQHIETFFEDPHTEAEQCEDCSLLHQLARIARKVSSQPAGATSDATSGVPGHPEVSEAVRSPQEPGEGS